MAENTLQNAIKAARAANIQRGGSYTNEFLRNKGISDAYTKLLTEAGLISTVTPEGYTVAQIESLAPTQAEAIARYYELRRNNQLASVIGEPISKESIDTLEGSSTVITSTPAGSNQWTFVNPVTGADMSATGVSQMGFGSSTTGTTTLNTGSAVGGNVTGQALMTQAQADRKSAYDLLYAQFKLYGLEQLVDPLKNLITENISPSEFTIRLRDTDAYKKRFSANQARINSGLRALSEAEYLALEDQYQDVMRRYGLPQSYYTRGDMGKQEGFDKFISGDVSPAELEDRIQTAQNRVVNAAPEVTTALKQFYPDITNGEILAYTLDPNKAIEEIKRKVTAAEIGAGALQSGLATDVTRAEELARFGVTGQAARQGYQAISSLLPRASQLADIYKQAPYTQTTAEAEVFGTTGASEAEKKRRQLAQLETAQFSGQVGAAGSALGRERAGQF